MTSYLIPDALVDTAWVDQHSNDTNLRILECDSDPTLYAQGHIPGALRLDTQGALLDANTRDLISANQFQVVVERLGISNSTEVLFYGDQFNIHACYAYWVFRSFGQKALHVLNGGRAKWISDGRRLAHQVPTVEPGRFKARMLSKEFRALRDDVLQLIGYPERLAPRSRMQGRALLDDRTRAEFEGVFAPDSGYPPRFLRAGHIPGATNVPWRDLLNPDRTFKSDDAIKEILKANGITKDKDVVVYTRIGERASLTWFVLHELLGYPKVRTYDGSWTEWGNTVGVPIENGSVVAVPARQVRSREGRQAAIPSA
jgi:thiosulfate/3-mercaptopyruvate sulfurtransferase